MKVGSLFSGIEGFGKGFENAGAEVIWQCEIDKNCRKLLDKYWPDIRIYDDVKEINATNVTSPDVLTGGFPCQDLSVAGKRAGLAGERSGLWWEFARIIEELHPRWVIIENVPGLLSSNEGRDMGILTGKLAEIGYWWAYRVLDAQYFGLAQRRKRVFIVAHLTEPTYPAKVLFEPESSERHSPPSREKRKTNPRTFTIRSGKEGGGKGYLDREDGAMTLGGQPQWVAPMASKALSASPGFSNREDSDTIILRTDQTKSNGFPVKFTNVSETLDSAQGQFVWDRTQITSKTNRSQPSKKVSHTLNYEGQMHVGVRRLTPLECERLQGFPDGYTEDFADTVRYKMLGNAVAVPVVEWIAKRIMEIEND